MMRVCKRPFFAGLFLYLCLFVVSVYANVALVPYEVTSGIAFCGMFAAVSFRLMTAYDKAFSGKESLFLDVFSVVYGLGAYHTASLASGHARFLYVLLPLLWILAKRSAEIPGKRTVAHILILTLAFSLDPIDALPMAVCLALMLFCERIADSLPVWPAVLCSVLSTLSAMALSAFSVLPAYKELFAENAINANAGLFLYNLTPTVLSTILICSVVYFFFSHEKERKKISYILCLFLLFLFSATSVFGGLASFGLYSAGATFAFDAALCFFACRIASKTDLMSFPKEKKLTRIAVVLVSLVLVLFTAILMKVPSGRETVFSMAFALAAFVVFIMALLSETKAKSRVILFVVFVDLVCNVFSVTTTSYHTDSANLMRGITEAFFEAGIGKRADAPTVTGFAEDVYADMIDAEEYAAFLSEHTDPIMEQVLTYVERRSDAEPFVYSDDFVRINEKCAALGCKEDLFVPVEEVEIFVEDMPYYRIQPVSDGIYNIEFTGARIQNDRSVIYIPVRLSCDEEPERDLYLYDSYSETYIFLPHSEVKAGTTVYLKFSVQDSFSVNFMLSVCTTNAETCDVLGQAVVLEKQNGDVDVIVPAKVLGWILSLWSLLFLVLIKGNGARALRESMHATAERIGYAKIVTRMSEFVRYNRFYLIAFFFPFFAFLLFLIVNGCIPFGPNSVFDQDGTQLYIPLILEGANAADTNSFLFSPNGGFGYGLVYTNGLSVLYSVFRGLSVAKLVGLISVWEAVALGLCGLSMAYYMTHRCFYDPADKSDLRILIPAFSYALCAYMIAIHMYPTWYLNVICFPLLVLGFERMITEKKYLLYGLMLLVSAVNNLQMLLYASVFLVLYFFTCRFSGGKDVCKKLIRFGLSSALALLPSVFVVYSTIHGTADSAYRDADAAFPMPGFHKSFFDQWKSYLLFSPTQAINPDDGGLNIYLGILILLLVTFFLFSGRRKLSDKLRFLVPVLFVTLTFNGQVLSFVMNGLHYQTNVPNRYAFLMAFLLGILAYEGVTEAKFMSKKRRLVAAACLLLFVCLTSFLGKERNTEAFILSAIVLCVYTLIFWFGKEEKRMIMSCLVLLGLELVIGVMSSGRYISFNEIAFYGDVDAERKALCALREDDAGLVSFPNSKLLCAGAYYDVPTPGLFNSFITKHQANTAELFGYLGGTNYLVDKSDGTACSN
ncbi:MAG: YfhO family protein, partial [Lachnospiraceae bacterium]|nr:YfhO family protein [Lachnospiraceae bacterium]